MGRKIVTTPRQPEDGEDTAIKRTLGGFFPNHICTDCVCSEYEPDVAKRMAVRSWEGKDPEHLDREAEVDDQGRSRRLIEGYASTILLDSYNTIILPSAFESSREAYFQRGGTLLYGHGQFLGLRAWPVGRIIPEYYIIDDFGLFVRAEIAYTSQGNDAWELIKMGAIRGFSVSFSPVLWEEDASEDPDNPIITFKDLILLEISIVIPPANPRTWFNMVRDKGFVPKSAEMAQAFEAIERDIQSEKKTIITAAAQPEPAVTERRIRVMPKTTLSEEKRAAIRDVDSFEKLGDVLEGMPSRDDVEALKGEFGRGLNELREQISKAPNRDEFNANNTQVARDLANIAQEQAAINSKLAQANKIAASRVSPADVLTFMKYLPENLDRDDLDILLHTPIKRDAPNGPVVRAMQAAWDGLIFMNVLEQGYRSHGISKPGVRSNIEKLEKSLKGMTGLIDSGLAERAFGTGVTGYGSNWAMTIPSPELFDMIDLEMRVEAEFEHYRLSGKTDSYPLKTSHAKAWTESAAANNNPAQYHKSQPGTSTIDFASKKMVVAIPVDEESVEGDSIINVIPILRADMAYALAYGMEDAIVNGDNSTTHMHTGLTTADMYTLDAFKGLIKKAIDDSKTFDVTSTSTGVGDATAAFVAKDLRYLRKLCGKMGVNPRDFRYLLSISGFFAALNFTEATQPGTYGAPLASWVSGDLPMFDGCPVIVSEAVRDDLYSSGVYTGVTGYTGVLGFNRRGFIVGDRRLVTIEFDKDIMTGQFRFVGSQRKDFQKKVPSTHYPVAYGYGLAA